jgi:hypothetical protein
MNIYKPRAYDLVKKAIKLTGTTDFKIVIPEVNRLAMRHKHGAIRNLECMGIENTGDIREIIEQLGQSA